MPRNADANATKDRGDYSANRLQSVFYSYVRLPAGKIIAASYTLCVCVCVCVYMCVTGRGLSALAQQCDETRWRFELFQIFPTLGSTQLGGKEGQVVAKFCDSFARRIIETMTDLMEKDERKELENQRRSRIGDACRLLVVRASKERGAEEKELRATAPTRSDTRAHRNIFKQHLGM